MKYTIVYTKRFDKGVQRCKKRHYPMEKLKEAILLLESNGELPAKFKPHKLSGNYEGKWECHLMPDWLMVWECHNDELTLIMVSTGTHSDLFK